MIPIAGIRTSLISKEGEHHIVGQHACKADLVISMMEAERQRVLERYIPSFGHRNGSINVLLCAQCAEAAKDFYRASSI
jgi:hypothetical protein